MLLSRCAAGLSAAWMALALLCAHSHAAATGHATACSAAPTTARFTVTASQSTGVVGQPIALDWRAPDLATATPAAPTYLVLLAPEAARFEGRGFFALMPGARGPYGMTYGADRMRTIVPLHTAFSAAAGTISMLLYDAGETTVEWAVVQVDACNQQVAVQKGEVLLDVMPGPPRLIGRDEFSSRRPDITIRPLKGPFQALIFGDAVEVSDAGTGEIVLQATGENPVFSPTGRFLTLRTGEAQVADVFDLVAERRVGRFEDLEGLYWSHEDSFLYIDRGWFGTMGIVRTVHGRRDAVGKPPSVSESPDEASTEADDDVLDAAGNAASEDIDPGSGGQSYTLGSEAWSLQVSIESGAAIFLNTNLNYSERTDLDFTDGKELGGRIIDLGRAKPMIRLKDEADLKAELRVRFGVDAPSPRGWNAGDGIWQTFQHEAFAEEDEPVADIENLTASAIEYRSRFLFRDDPTQEETEGGATIEIAKGAAPAGILRGAVSLGDRSPTRRIAGGEALRSHDQRTLRNLRSGEDDKALRRISNDLSRHYDRTVARWRFSAGQVAYGTAPFPDPEPDTAPEEPSLVDLAAEGRDTWTWKIGTREFWLTQTVESGRRGHAFGFSMLGLDDGRLLRTDLLREVERASDDEATSDRMLLEIGDLRGELGAAFAAPSFVAVADERYLLVAMRPVVRLIAFDLVSFKPACSVRAPFEGADVERIALARDGGHLFQFNQNGQVNIYDCRDGARVLSGLFADDELIVMDEDGYFDGSEDAAAYVELKIPGLPGRHVLSQFAGKLRRPGLLEAVLARKQRSETPATVTPPALTVSAAGQASTGSRLTLRAQSDGGLKSLEIFADGRLALRRELSGKSATVILDKADLPRTGFATVIVSDLDGLTSAPAEILLDTTFPRSPGRLIGLAIGVDDYPGLRSNLRFAASDARRITAASGTSKLYSATDVTMLTNRKATGAAILARLDAMVADAGEHDTILLSFAGHGLLGNKGDLHLALSGTQASDIEGTSLDFNVVAARLTNARAKVVVLLDACHAGVSAQLGAAANDVAVRQLVTGNGSGIVVLAASKGRQFSEESASLGGGRFSVAFERSLNERRSASDLDGNGALSVLELYRAVKQSVSAETGGRQVPWIARNKIYGDFDIF